MIIDNLNENPLETDDETNKEPIIFSPELFAVKGAEDILWDYDGEAVAVRNR